MIYPKPYLLKGDYMPLSDFHVSFGCRNIHCSSWTEALVDLAKAVLITGGF